MSTYIPTAIQRAAKALDTASLAARRDAAKAPLSDGRAEYMRDAVSRVLVQRAGAELLALAEAWQAPASAVRAARKNHDGARGRLIARASRAAALPLPAWASLREWTTAELVAMASE